MCTDRRFQPWAPCLWCKPDQTGLVHPNALREFGVQLGWRIDTETDTDTFWRLQRFRNCLEYRNIFILTHGQRWAIKTDTSWEGQPLFTATNKQQAQQSISIVTIVLLWLPFFKAVLWRRGILRADTEVQEPIFGFFQTLCHFRIVRHAATALSW